MQRKPTLSVGGIQTSTVVMLRHDLTAKRTRSLRRHEPQMGQRRNGGCAF
jgi:hypothetical protein